MKLYDKNCITLDGRMDEPVWEELEAHTGFRRSKIKGGQIAPVQTEFKVLPCEDRVYIGVKCFEPEMPFVTKLNPQLAIWTCDDVEIFLSPSNNYFDFYQFAVTFEGQTASLFYSEGGNIQPDPYRPIWNSAVYKGEDFWSMEVEFPLTAFYMTPADVWSDTWLVNVCRTRCYKDGNSHRRAGSSWSPIEKSVKDSKCYLPIQGFPMRPADQDVRMTAAIVEIKEDTTCTEEEINAFCASLPRYKRPRKIIFAKVLRNATGKIEKPKLREIYGAVQLVAKQNQA